MDRID